MMSLSRASWRTVKIAVNLVSFDRPNFSSFALFPIHITISIYAYRQKYESEVIIIYYYRPCSFLLLTLEQRCSWGAVFSSLFFHRSLQIVVYRLKIQRCIGKFVKLLFSWKNRAPRIFSRIIHSHNIKLMFRVIFIIIGTISSKQTDFFLFNK